MTQQVPTRTLQGIVVPESAVNAELFFKATRRQTILAGVLPFPGFGSTLNLSMLQTGILAGLTIKFTGTLVVTLAGGTAASTARWPYDLLKAVRFSANGQSNLINASGWSLKARDVMSRSDYNDRGVSRGIGGASPGTARTQGTLSLSTEEWGVGSNVTAIPGAPTNYAVELNWFVPLAFDQVNLLGAIFAQTSSTDLLLQMDIAPTSELFTLTGAATAVFTGAAFTVEEVLYSIPQGPDGGIVVPDLSVFHSLLQTRFTQASNGEFEIRLAGQGVGRQLMRMFFRTWSGATPAPLPLNNTNYGRLFWRYGGNETPEVFTDGRHLAQVNERLFGSDLASLQGFGVWDFASEHAFRDSVDEGAATELRLGIEIPNAVVLTSPFVEYVQETVFAGAVGA